MEENKKFTPQLIDDSNIEFELLSLQVIGDYSNGANPFDQFDTDCHQEGEFNVWGGSKEEDITFMINVAEHC